eukprot:RCo046735
MVREVASSAKASNPTRSSLCPRLATTPYAFPVSPEKCVMRLVFAARGFGRAAWQTERFGNHQVSMDMSVCLWFSYFFFSCFIRPVLCPGVVEYLFWSPLLVTTISCIVCMCYPPISPPPA